MSSSDGSSTLPAGVFDSRFATAKRHRRVTLMLAARRASFSASSCDLDRRVRVPRTSGIRLRGLRSWAMVAAWVLVVVVPATFLGADDDLNAQRSRAVAPKDGPIVLFDGKSLDAFYTWLNDTKREDPRKVFQVTDGMIHVSGDGLGCLTTKREYRDYHLVLEYRWGQRTWGARKERTRDSGLLIHSVGADGGYHGTWMPSLEVQIIEGGVGDFILVAGNDEEGKPVPLSVTCEVGRDRDGEVVWKKGGRKETFNLKNRKRINWYGRDPDWKDVLGFRGRNDVESPGFLWTRLDVLCDGGHVAVYVNGKQVNEAFDVVPSFGRLQLQSELAEIFVRKWELWPAGKGPKPAPAIQDGR